MNIAWLDIRYHYIRFLFTTAGIGLLFSATIGMVGLYRGVVYEALMIINEIGADLWVVQGEREGPFAEDSELPTSLERRLEGVPGVAWARRFIQFNQQQEIGGRRMRIATTGIDFPADTGSWVPLIAGRHLYSGHYEAIVNQSLGFDVGARVRLGHDDYTIVGITRGQVDMAGDGIMFVTIPDAQTIKSESPSEAILLRRATGSSDARHSVAAIMVGLQFGADLEAVKDYITDWGDVSVFSRDEEQDILLNSRMWRLRIQILAFVVMTFLVMIIIVSLSIYTMTLEKLHQIALLKLLGARDRFIVGMILQQSLLLGATAFVTAVIWAHLIFPHFPRTVLILPSDLAVQGVIALVLCAAASWFAIRKALSVRAQDILS